MFEWAQAASRSVQSGPLKYGPGKRILPKSCWKIEVDSLPGYLGTRKLYAEEIWSPAVQHAVLDADLVASSLISYAETRSALARKYRSREVTRGALNRLREEFERDWARLHLLPVDDAVVRKAGDLADEHALRALDAVHLATADFLQAVLRTAVTFACFDNGLNEAAKMRGLKLLS